MPVGFFLLLGRSVPAGRRQTPSEPAAGSRLPPRRPCLIRPAASGDSLRAGGRRRRVPLRRILCRAHGPAQAARRRMGGGGVRGGAARVAVPAVVRAGQRDSAAGSRSSAIDVLLALRGGLRRPAGDRHRDASAWPRPDRPVGAGGAGRDRRRAARAVPDARRPRRGERARVGALAGRWPAPPASGSAPVDGDARRRCAPTPRPARPIRGRTSRRRAREHRAGHRAHATSSRPRAGCSPTSAARSA